LDGCPNRSERSSPVNNPEPRHVYRGYHRQKRLRGRGNVRNLFVQIITSPTNIRLPHRYVPSLSVTDVSGPYHAFCSNSLSQCGLIPNSITNDKMAEKLFRLEQGCCVCLGQGPGKQSERRTSQKAFCPTRMRSIWKFAAFRLPGSIWIQSG
jgi:hypothetical protein